MDLWDTQNILLKKYLKNWNIYGIKFVKNLIQNAEAEIVYGN